MAMSDRNWHKYPWIQLLLYDYNLEPSRETMYEMYELGDELIMYRVANLQTSTNVLIKFDPNVENICRG